MPCHTQLEPQCSSWPCAAGQRARPPCWVAPKAAGWTMCNTQQSLAWFCWWAARFWRAQLRQAWTCSGRDVGQQKHRMTDSQPCELSVLERRMLAVPRTAPCVKPSLARKRRRPPANRSRPSCRTSPSSERTWSMERRTAASCTALEMVPPTSRFCAHRVAKELGQQAGGESRRGVRLAQRGRPRTV